MKFNHLLSLIIIVGLLVRIILAPYSSGSDIPQFYGFANTFLRHGFSFYSYAYGSYYRQEGWAYPWAYVYPPLPIFFFVLVRLISSGSTNVTVENINDSTIINTGLVSIEVSPNYNVYVNPLWIVSIKSIFILFDTINAILLYILSGKGRKGYLISALYYLNPMTIYISAIYGMFDQIALAFILLSLFFLKRNLWVSGLFMGLALATKQTMWVAFIPFLVYLFSSFRMNRSVNFLISSVLTFAFVFSPFIIFDPKSLYNIFRVFLNPEGQPGYTEPVVYSFNGISSLMTYYKNLEAIGRVVPFSDSVRLTIIRLWFLPFIILIILSIISTNISKDPLKGLVLGYVSFTATYWRINHQYLVPLIGFLALYMIRKKCSPINLALIVISGLWPIMFPTSFWFHVHLQSQFINVTLMNLVDSLTLKIFDEFYYVVYSLILTMLLYIFIMINTIPDILTMKNIRLKIGLLTPLRSIASKLYRKVSSKNYAP